MSFGIGEKICDGKLEGVVAKPRDEDDEGGEDLIHPDDYTGCVHTLVASQPWTQNPRILVRTDVGKPALDRGERRGGGTRRGQRRKGNREKETKTRREKGAKEPRSVVSVESVNFCCRAG